MSALWAVIVDQLVFDFSHHNNAKDSVHVHHFSCKEASCQRVWSKRGMLCVLNQGMRVNQTDSGTQLADLWWSLYICANTQIFKPLNLIWFAKLATGRVLQYDSLLCIWIYRPSSPQIPNDTIQRYTSWHMCECQRVCKRCFYYAICSAQVFPKHNMYSCTFEDTKT